MRRPPTISELVRDHRPDAIAGRLASRPPPSALRDAVYGAIDGIVTTFAVVAGVAGSGLGADAVLALGFANLAGDGFSMAAANYLGIRSELRRRERIRHEEERHIALVPEGEREEIRQLLAQDGLTGRLLDDVTDTITSDRRRWVDTMLVREYGLPLRELDPWRGAVTTFAAFLLAGMFPLLVFLVDAWPAVHVPVPFAASSLLAGLAFLAVGALEGRVVDQPIGRAALRTAAIGGAAAGIAYAVGLAVGAIV
jgi:VIT1/CCC1 family predicted Fe2+/Mn2+ transporter